MVNSTIRKSATALVLCGLSVIVLAPGGVATARAESLIFDLEDQIAAPSATAQGKLTFLSLAHNGLTLEITRPGSVFDLVPPPEDADYRRPAPASWGQVSLSSFYDMDGPAPLNINFSAPVAGFSVWMGDFGDDTDTLELEAFALPNGQGQSLGRVRKTLEAHSSDFSYQELSVSAPAIRSVRLLGGSERFPHSMFYDHFRIETAPASS